MIRLRYSTAFTEFFREHQSSRRNKNSELSYVAECKLFSDVSSSLINPWKKSSSFGSQRAANFVRLPSGSPVYNFRFRCPCKECISGSFRIEVLPVRRRLLPFRTTVFNLRNNLFYGDFIWSWGQTAIWSLNYWIVVPTFGFHGNNKCEFRTLKFKILSKTSIFWKWYELEM